MRPSAIQRVLAHGLAIAGWIGALGGAAWAVGACEPSLATLVRGRELLAVAIAGAAGLGLGWLLCVLFLWPLFLAIAARLNGAPFHVGDRVCVLKGVHRGRVTTAYEIWGSRNQVRVDLGEAERIAVKDVFFYSEVARVGDPSEP